MIRPSTPDDAAAIAAIYNHYVRETIVTFEEVEVSGAEMAKRITASHLWLVREDDGAIVGFAYAGRFRERSAYRHTAESTIYLHPEATGRGRGRELYAALLGRLRSLPIHRVLGVIALPNPASIALHERLGFAKCAHLPQVGRKLGRWIDVGYWGLALDAAPEGSQGIA